MAHRYPAGGRFHFTADGDMSDIPQPVQIPIEDGEICFKQMCMKPATWRIGTKFYCYDHMALAEWLPGVPKTWTGPRGKKNQLKFEFTEGSNGQARKAGKDGNERQGNQDAQGVPGGRTGDAVGVGEEGVPVDGREVDDEGQQLGQKLAPLPDSDENGQAGCAGSLPEMPGDAEEDEEEGHAGDCPDFGSEAWEAEGEPGAIRQRRR